ncbi:MAG: HAMP domain-containing sensor histidine kinase [Planctomycetota bacterium]
MRLRVRLVGLYALVVAGTLAVFSAALHHEMRAGLVQALDRELETRAQAIATELEFGAEAWTIEPAAALLGDYGEESGRYYLVVEAAGPVRLRSPLAASLGLEPPGTLGGRDTVRDTARFREVCVRCRPEDEHVHAPSAFQVVCGASMLPVDAALAAMRSRAWILAPVALLLSMLGGLWLVAHALRPIARIAATAEQIGADNLSQRIDVGGSDELGRLAHTLNGTFARLQAAFAREKRFTADASHELRTPLAVIEANVELAKSRPRTAEELAGMLDEVGLAGARMRATVSGLLTLARADAGALPLQQRPVSLPALAAEVLAAQERGAAAARIRLDLEAPHDVVVRGDPERLGELLANLVANAIRYNRPGGRVLVTVALAPEAGRHGPAEIAVQDTGIGIDPCDQPRVFERFFRADPARARAEADESGIGLGLAIAKWIAEAHGGTIALTSEPGIGSRFVVRLPVVATGTAPARLSSTEVERVPTK